MAIGKKPVDVVAWKKKNLRRPPVPLQNASHSTATFSVHRIHLHSWYRALNTCCASKGYVSNTAAVQDFFN